MISDRITLYRKGFTSYDYLTTLYNTDDNLGFDRDETKRIIIEGE